MRAKGPGTRDQRGDRRRRRRGRHGRKAETSHGVRKMDYIFEERTQSLGACESLYTEQNHEYLYSTGEYTEHTLSVRLYFKL
jgi:hypothetical protein